MRKWIGFSLLGALVIALALLIWRLDIPNWEKLDLARVTAPPESSVVYDAKGSAAGTLGLAKKRAHVALADVPERVRQAFIAAEDQRFYAHNGVDLRRIFGALWHDLKTLSLSQGASTITQQLIKLTHLSAEKTLSRKVQEAFLAIQLEKKLDKDEILEAYLNVVYFGNGAYGLESAAQAYFSRSADQLTLAQGALLAGIIKSPSGYAPHLHEQAALKRRNYVLERMRALGAIDEAQCAAAQAEPLGLALAENSDVGGGWYMDLVLTEVMDALDMSADEVRTAGLHIYTALDPELQAQAEALFESGANFPDPAPDGTPAQAALIALDARSGGIAAVVGGREYQVQLGLNRATQARRQPGSAIKPVSTYAAAIEQYGFLPCSMIQDVQREFAGKYLPGNAGGAYYGTVTLREALSRSLNVATVDLADLIGISSVRRQLTQFGVPLSAQDVNLSLALGSLTNGVSPARLAAAYCALANGGMRVQPHALLRVTSASGRLLYAAEAADARAVSAQTAFLVTDMLKTAARSGSAKALQAAGVPIAGKTGTVGEHGGGNRDIWTVGCTPELAVAVWMGFDQSDAAHALPDAAGGSSYPARLCAAFFSGVRGALSGDDFAVPAGLVSAQIDARALSEYDAVLLAAQNTPEAYAQTEWFPQGRAPESVSTLWNAPEAVDDLALLSASDEAPVLAFTSRDAAADYLILRKSGESSEIAAVLGADAGHLIVWRDDAAALNEAHSYSVLPRHRLLYESGTLLTGGESNAVSYAPGGLMNRIFGVGA